MDSYIQGDELSIRLLGYATPYQVIARVDGVVAYNIAEKMGEVDDLYFNLKTKLSEDAFAGRKDVEFMMLTITSPLMTNLKEGQTLFVSKDLYDPSLTTKAKERDEYTLKISIDHDVVNGDTPSMEAVIQSIEDLLGKNSSVDFSLSKIGITTDNLLLAQEEKYERQEKILATILNVDIENLAKVAGVDFIGLGEALAALLTKYETALADIGAS